jgi:hypothetical protein
MDDRGTVLEQIEQAQRDVPTCETCGEPTVPVAHDSGSIWLECTTLHRPQGTLRRLLALDLVAGHTRRRIAGAAQARRAA